MLEKCLIDYCAPTLASLKTANLFNITVVDEAEYEEQMQALNEKFQEKGLFLMEMRRNKGKALVYVYRKSYLERDLLRPDIGDFLKTYGYGQMDVEMALRRLQMRLQISDDFPHEIGIFLGYPLEDVIGFIENDGKNSKCSGWWKVYGDEQEAKRRFELFGRCRSAYTRLWNDGRSAWQLTVAA